MGTYRSGEPEKFSKFYLYFHMRTIPYSDGLSDIEGGGRVAGVTL